MNTSRIKKVIRHSQMVGNHFFDKETMRFWVSEIESDLFQNNTFVTSEDNFDRSKRLYTVRKYNPETGDISTIGKFQQFETIDEAIKFALSVDE